MIKIQANEIKIVDIKNLRTKKGNRNNHPQKQIEMLAKHFEHQGFRNPLIVSNQSGEIVCGNGRFLAALRAGIKELPVIYQDFESKEQEYQYHVADNGLGLWSELDYAGINADLIDLGPFDIDMLGIKDFKVDVSEINKASEDTVPDVKKPTSKLGDLYILGEHRLLCGDSTDKELVDRLMNGDKADMVFTDPPYGIGESSQFFNGTKRKKGYDDETTFDLTKINLETDFVIWGGNYYEKIPIPRNKIGWVVWDKRPSRDTWQEGDGKRDAADRIFGQHFEIAITNVTKARGHILRKTWGGFYGTAGNDIDKIVHKTQKPVDLLDMCADKKHVNILDYFCGSGSTLIACEKTKRKCYAMELDPQYIDVIVTRYVNFTGNKEIIKNGERISWPQSN